MARKLTVVIYIIIDKKKEFVVEHAFKILEEKKVKNSAERSAISHRSSMEEMILYMINNIQ